MIRPGLATLSVLTAASVASTVPAWASDTPAVPVTDAAAPSAANWVQVGSDHVSGQDERPVAVSAPTAGDVWAVGYRLVTVGGATEFRTLAQHYDGTRFQTVPTPDRETAPARDVLAGVSGATPGDVWAVGTTLSGTGRDTTLVEHWDGARWTIADSPDPGPSNVLEAVSAATSSDVWAVGARTSTSSFYQRPLTLHWNGATWTPVPVPHVPGCTGHSYLTAVSALTTGSAWATGWCGSGGTAPERGYVIHWDGSSWSVPFVVSQKAAPASETYGIAARSDRDVWLVGYSVQGSQRTAVPLVYHFTGSSWVRQAGPPSAQSLAGVTAGRSGVWAVGDGTSPQPPFAGPAAGRLADGRWQDRPVPVDFGRLSGVTTAPDGQIWAVGTQILPDGHNTGLLLHR